MIGRLRLATGLMMLFSRIPRILLGGEAAVLDTLGVAAARAVATRPQRSPLVPRRRVGR